MYKFYFPKCYTLSYLEIEWGKKISRIWPWPVPVLMTNSYQFQVHFWIAWMYVLYIFRSIVSTYVCIYKFILFYRFIPHYSVYVWWFLVKCFSWKWSFFILFIYYNIIFLSSLYIKRHGYYDFIVNIKKDCQFYNNWSI